MKAWQLEGFSLDQLVLNDIPEPTPGDGEALVRVSAVSLNYRDKLVVDGLYNPHLTFPMTQVADAVGEVLEACSIRSRRQERTNSQFVGTLFCVGVVGTFRYALSSAQSCKS